MNGIASDLSWSSKLKSLTFCHPLESGHEINNILILMNKQNNLQWFINLEWGLLWHSIDYLPALPKPTHCQLLFHALQFLVYTFNNSIMDSILVFFLWIVILSIVPIGKVLAICWLLGASTKKEYGFKLEDACSQRDWWCHTNIYEV